MKETTNIEYKGKMEFDVELNGHHFPIDAVDAVGGENKGPRPKALILSALAGCTGMDVVSILKKMKITDFSLKIDVEAELTEEHPRIFKDMLINFRFEGQDLPANKIARAVDLSETRYCGVTAMLEKTVQIKSNIFINQEQTK